MFDTQLKYRYNCAKAIPPMYSFFPLTIKVKTRKQITLRINSICIVRASPQITVLEWTAALRDNVKKLQEKYFSWTLWQLNRVNTGRFSCFRIPSNLKATTSNLNVKPSQPTSEFCFNVFLCLLTVSYLSSLCLSSIFSAPCVPANAILVLFRASMEKTFLSLNLFHPFFFLRKSLYLSLSIFDMCYFFYAISSYRVT